MSAPTISPRAKLPITAYGGKPTIRIVTVTMPVCQAEATTRPKVRFELPARGGTRDPDYEAPWCPVWTDRGGRPTTRTSRLRAWLRRVRKHFSCFN